MESSTSTCMGIAQGLIMESSDKKTIYFVIDENEDGTSQTYPFSNVSTAIEQARALAKHLDIGWGKYVEVPTSNFPACLLFCVLHSDEFSHVRVEEIELDKEIDHD